MIFKHWMSTRPEGHPERTEAIEYTGGIATDGLHLVVAATLADHQPVVDAYTAARVANEAAATKVAQDSDRVHEASAAFTDAFKAWTVSIDHANAMGYAAKVLPAQLGGKTIGAFLGLPDWDKISRFDTLAVHVAATPSLVGDPMKDQAVKDALEVLRAALGDARTSAGARTDASKALVEASDAFDFSYGWLVRTIEHYYPEGLGTEVPRFQRVRPVSTNPPVEHPVDPPVPEVEGESPAEPPSS